MKAEESLSTQVSRVPYLRLSINTGITEICQGYLSQYCPEKSLIILSTRKVFLVMSYKNENEQR
jgi:hypothetical protein